MLKSQYSITEEVQVIDHGEEEDVSLSSESQSDFRSELSVIANNCSLPANA